MKNSQQDYYGIALPSLDGMKLTKWIQSKSIAMNTYTPIQRKQFVLIWKFCNTFSDTKGDYENTRARLSEAVDLINSTHHIFNSKADTYYSVMEYLTKNVCLIIGQKPSLKNREELLIASTIHFNKEAIYALKYNLFKDGTPVWDLFKTEYEREICRPLLEKLGYKPVKQSEKRVEVKKD